MLKRTSPMRLYCSRSLVLSTNAATIYLNTQLDSNYEVKNEFSMKSLGVFVSFSAMSLASKKVVRHGTLICSHRDFDVLNAVNYPLRNCFKLLPVTLSFAISNSLILHFRLSLNCKTACSWSILVNAFPSVAQ